MELNGCQLTDIQVVPYVSPVSLEFGSVLPSETGHYVWGGLDGMAYEALCLDTPGHELFLGATYAMSGLNPSGKRVQTHWMYCTQTTPTACFGISKNLRFPTSYGPAPFLSDSLFVSLEPLRDITGFSLQAPTDMGLSEYKISGSGDLISTGFGTPHALGIRVTTPFLPSHFLKGARDLTLVAVSTRTGQSIGLDRLTCLQASAPAVFLQEAAVR